MAVVFDIPEERIVSHKIRLIGQIALLAAIYWGSNKLVFFTGIPIPGNVVGVLLLFGLLCFGVIKLEYIQDAADFLLKHLVFFFIPVAVDLMNWGPVFYKYGFELALAIVISTFLTFFLTGYATQLLQRGKNRCRN